MPPLPEPAMTDPDTAVTPLTAQRARAAIRIMGQALQAGEMAVTYSELARRLGMSKVNGQGLNAYLIEAAAICAEQGLPNIGVLVVSQDSLAAGEPMPAQSALDMCSCACRSKLPASSPNGLRRTTPTAPSA